MKKKLCVYLNERDKNFLYQKTGWLLETYGNAGISDTFEKALRLKEILKFFNEHEYLSEHLLLKGGTAINMTIFNLPRLSVDIDMDYVPNGTRDEMLSAREQIASVIKEYMDAEGYQLSPAYAGN